MNVSFEDLADAGLPNENPKPAPTHWLRRLLFLIVIIFVGWAASAFYGKVLDEPRPLPEAAKRLLVVEGEVPEGVLPHKLDDATEFEASFENLKEGAKAPKFRQVSLVEEAEVMTVPTTDVETETSIESAKPLDPVLIEPMPLREPAVARSAVRSAMKVRELPIDSVVDIQFDRDWEGVVMVPNNVKLARAYTSEVRLRRVEAHPIDGGRLRVWSRVENLTDRDMFVETACEFRSAEKGVVPLSFRPGMIPANGAMDVSFVSTRNDVDSYTLMVKR